LGGVFPRYALLNFCPKLLSDRNLVEQSFHGMVAMQRSGEESRVRRSKHSSHDDSIERSGGAIITLLQQAADDNERAVSLAQELSVQLQASEDRAERLQARVEQLESDARKSEQWLAYIRKEIEDKFFSQKEAGSQSL
jgi:hypothetical protein